VTGERQLTVARRLRTQLPAVGADWTVVSRLQSLEQILSACHLPLQGVSARTTDREDLSDPDAQGTGGRLDHDIRGRRVILR
jgi:hypothetical protein